jgi:acyl carrier protein phosphodiesterase
VVAPLNYLAHLFLAQRNPLSRMGNLLGDYRRGEDTRHYPQVVQRGLANHLAVDRYTDTHPLISESKALFSRRRRRFAGVALDVLFDHFLIRHWHSFSARDHDAFLDESYCHLLMARPIMPPRMQRHTQLMVEHDWFRQYALLDNIGMALDRIAARIRFRNGFAGMIEEIRAHESTLEERFLLFFPELVRHVHDQGIETRAMA